MPGLLRRVTGFINRWWTYRPDGKTLPLCGKNLLRPVASFACCSHIQNGYDGFAKAKQAVEITVYCNKAYFMVCYLTWEKTEQAITLCCFNQEVYYGK